MTSYYAETNVVIAEFVDKINVLSVIAYNFWIRVPLLGVDLLRCNIILFALA